MSATPEFIDKEIINNKVMFFRDFASQASTISKILQTRDQRMSSIVFLKLSVHGNHLRVWLVYMQAVQQ